VLPFYDATYEQLEEMLSLIEQLPSEQLGYFYHWVNLTLEDFYGGVDPLDATESIIVLRNAVSDTQSGIV
jgi:hypothetical protein